MKRTVNVAQRNTLLILFLPPKDKNQKVIKSQNVKALRELHSLLYSPLLWTADPRYLIPSQPLLMFTCSPSSFIHTCSVLLLLTLFLFSPDYCQIC